MSKIRRRMPPTLKAASRRAPAGRIRVASGTYGYGPRDAFRQKRAPSKAELVQAYRAAVYCCARLNAEVVAAQPIRLYATTDRSKGQKSPRERGVRTKALDRRRERHLEANPTLSKRLAGVDEVEEVVDHPILGLFDEVNPWFNRSQLWEATQLYLEITGGYYWYKVTGVGGVPIEVWPLPSWLITPMIDYTGTDVVTAYSFAGGGGQAMLDPADVLWGRELSLFDPYVGEWSWLRANYDVSQVYDKNLDYRDSVLTNRGRPDAMLVPKEEGMPFTVDWAAIQRIQMEYEQSFTLGRAGRLWVPPGGLELKPISWSPQDMGEIALSKSILHDIARAANVPVPLIDGESANRANMDAALVQHARMAIKPRCRKLAEHLNSNFVPLWDARLFLEFDDPVPADKVLERESHIAYVGAGIVTRGEVRSEIGRPSVEGDDELMVSNSLVPLSRAVAPPEPTPVVSAGRPQTGAEVGDEMETADEGADDEAFEEGDDTTQAGKAMGAEHRRPFAAGGRTKFNPNHGPDGRFVGHGGGGGRLRDMADAHRAAKGSMQLRSRKLHLAVSIEMGKAQKAFKKALAAAKKNPTAASVAKVDALSTKLDVLGKRREKLGRLIEEYRVARKSRRAGRLVSKDHPDRGADGAIPDPDDDRDRHEDNTFGLPDGAPLRRALKRWFRRQLREVLKTLPTIGVALPSPGQWRKLADYDDPMAAAMTPILGAYWDEAGKETRARLGLDPDDWRVVDPHTREKIEQAALNFCAETNATTTMELDAALARLRQELAEGVVDRGETVRQLRKRVQAVFTKASDYRAEMIARTEASRAVHEASLESAKQSGVVAGQKWLASANACELCLAEEKRTNERPVGLDEPFTHHGNNPVYSTIRTPPLHPSCRCSTVYVLTPEYEDLLAQYGPESPTFEPGALGPEPKDYALAEPAGVA